MKQSSPACPTTGAWRGVVRDLPLMPAAGRNAAYHWPSVANAALASMARGLFPTAPSPLQAQISGLEAAPAW